MAEILFKRGALAQLPTTAVDGTFYVTTDEGAIYLGVGTEMKRLGDYVTVANISALKALDTAKVSQSALYYAVAENVLARWNGTRWVQINAVGLSNIVQAGAGDYVASVETFVNDDGDKVVKVTKADLAQHSTITTMKQDIANAQADLKTLLGDGASGSIAQMIEDAVSPVSAKADKNAEDIAALKTTDTTMSGQITGLDTRLGTAEGKITALEGTVANNKAAAEQAIADLKGTAVDYATLGAVETKLDSIDGEITGIKNAASTLEGRVAANEGAIAKLNGNASTEGSVDYKIAQKFNELMDNPDETLNSIQELVDWTTEHAADALEMSNQVTQNKNDITGIKGRLDTAEGAIATIQGEGEGSIKKAVADLKGNTSAYHTLAALETALAGVKSTADTAKSVNDTQNGKIEAIEGRLDTAESGITGLDGRLDTAESEIDALQTAVNTTLPNQITSLGTALRGGAAETVTLNTLKSTNDDHEDRIGNLEAGLTWGSFN